MEKKINKLTCVVCGKKFTDCFTHVLKGNGILTWKDKAHADYGTKVQGSGYEMPCFCGGTIGWYGSEDSYSVSCTTCDFLFHED
jgi:hypothetical protein